MAEGNDLTSLPSWVQIAGNFGIFIAAAAAAAFGWVRRNRPPEEFSGASAGSSTERIARALEGIDGSLKSLNIVTVERAKHEEIDREVSRRDETRRRDERDTDRRDEARRRDERTR